jgi:hypothetical protein
MQVAAGFLAVYHGCSRTNPAKRCPWSYVLAVLGKVKELAQLMVQASVDLVLPTSYMLCLQSYRAC